jgi:hypothetical protein
MHGKKTVTQIEIQLSSLDLSERNEESTANRANLRTKIRIRDLTNTKEFCTNLAETLGLRDESFLQKYLSAFLEISSTGRHSLRTTAGPMTGSAKFVAPYRIILGFMRRSLLSAMLKRQRSFVCVSCSLTSSVSYPVICAECHCSTVHSNIVNLLDIHEIVD